MGKITVAEFVSLDGVMEDPGGAEGYKHGGWTFKYPDDEGMKFKFDELMEHDVQLLGRVTYEGFAKAWPDMIFRAVRNRAARSTLIDWPSASTSISTVK